MGKVMTNAGGGGTASDECTAYRSNVVEGHTAVTADSNDEPGWGTLPAKPISFTSLALETDNNKKMVYSYIPYGAYLGSNVDGKTGAGAVVWDTYQTFVNHLGITSGMIRAGYSILGVNGDSWVVWTGDCTADTSHVLSGKTFYTNGTKRTGTLTVQSVVNFKVAQYSNLTLIASWALPSKGPWSGLRVMCKQGSYPTSASDGTLFYEGSGTYATKALAAGTWYFRAWNYMTTNYGRIYNQYLDASVNNVQVKGQQTFTSSGVFTVPAYVRKLQVFLVGAGGSGGKSDYYQRAGEGGPGGGGGYTLTTTIDVTPGSNYQVSIGAPVAVSTANNGVNKSGSSSFGSLTASGGEGNYSWYYPTNRAGSGGNGGSGGGHIGESSNYDAGDGGSDGSDGYRHASSVGSGIGQHTTTRAFGESNGTLYSGGGGGGGYVARDSQTYGSVGLGGAGGGGNGGYSSSVTYRLGHPGGANTGGGGGGGGCTKSSASNYEGGLGGSGICIVRWGY